MVVVGHLRNHLHPPVDGPGMQDQRPGLGQRETGFVQPETAPVFAQGRQESAALPLVLDPQKHHRVRILQGVLQAVGQGDRGPEGVRVSGKQGGRSPQADGGPQGGQRPDVGTGHAGMPDVADDGEPLSGEVPQALAHGEGVQQALGGVLAGAVARVHHRRGGVRGDETRSPGAGVAHHEDIRAHGLYVPHRVAQALPLGGAGDGRAEVHGARAQALFGGLEGKPGAGAVLEEQVHDQDAREARGHRSPRIEAVAEGLGGVQDRDKVLLGKAAQAGEMPGRKAPWNAECGLRHGDRV